MPTIELYLRGDQIGSYASVSAQGNNDQMQVTLSGVQALGGASDVFRVVVRQVNDGQTGFQNGQMVDIYSYPAGTLLHSGLNAQHDQFQGRASSSGHQVFTSPSNVVFHLAGITGPVLQYGPGPDPPRSETLPFANLYPQPPAPPCFTPGTRILTDRGPVAVEVLRPGDRVWTRDNGFRSLRWVGRRVVPGTGRFAPLRLAAGAFGNERALLVSPQHRILLTGWRAELAFGEPEVLAAAAHLQDGGSVRAAPCPRVTYLHIAFDRHEIVLAEGMMTESLLPGPMALAAMGPAAQAELRALFPELRAPLPRALAARPCLTAREAGLLAAQRSSRVLSPSATRRRTAG